MFIIKYYIAISALAALLAYLSTNAIVTVILAWIALSLGAVSAAYVTKNPSIFRKRSNGGIPWVMRWIFWPFFLGAQVYNIWARKNDSVPAFQKIDEQLYLACRLFPSDAAQLKEEGISSILDATAEFSGLNWTAQSISGMVGKQGIAIHK
jgi:hypothetical protein